MKSNWNEEMAIESIHIMLIDHEEMLWEISDSPHDKWLAEEEASNSRGKLIQYVKSLIMKEDDSK